MPALSFAEFESEVRRAEDEFAAAQWHRAFARYADVFRRRVHDLRFLPEALTDTDLLVLERIADIAVPIGQTAAADLLYAVACDVHRSGRPERFILSAIKRVHIALAADRFDEALRLARETEAFLGALADIECTDEGLALWEHLRPWDPRSEPAVETQIYLVLGRLLAGAGQFEQAITFFRRGLVHAAADHVATARDARGPLNLALAAARLSQGDIRQAEAILSAPDSDFARPTDRIRARELEASVAVQRGAFARAVEALSVAVELCRDLALTTGLASLLVSRAKVLLVLNLTAESERDLDEAGAIGAGPGDGGLRDRLTRLQAYSRARQRTLFGGAPLADAVASLQTGVPRAMSIAPASRHAVASWRPADFMAFYEERELELMTLVQAQPSSPRIEELLRVLREDFDHTDSRHLQTRLTLMSGICGVHRGDWERALELCGGAAAAFEELGFPAEELVARRFQALCLERMPSRQADLPACRRRTETLLASLTKAMSGSMSEAFLVNKWSQRDAEIADAVTQLLADQVQLRTRRGPGRWLAGLAWATRVYALHRCLSVLGNASPSQAAASWTGRVAAFWRLVRHPLRDQTLDFTVLANGVVLLAVRWCHCEMHWAPVTRARVRTLVRRFHERLAAGDPERQIVAAASELATEVGFAATVDHVPSRIRRLKIYPDDQLNGFPFAVIPLDSEQQVVDRFAVTIGIRRMAAPARRRRPRRAVLGASRGAEARPALPEARRQLEWLSQWWRDRGVETSVLGEGLFGVRALLDALAGSQIVHFSGHGVFDPDSPDRTGILVDAGNGGEAIVSLKELAGVDCSTLTFATFLACWSADSFSFPGRWTVGIPSTLCGAGAGTVVAPLWEIEDAVSTDLLIGMFTRLEHDRIDEALRHAQLAVRSGPDSRRRASFFWAAAQVYGDGGRLTIR